jgi:hypothetical protein
MASLILDQGDAPYVHEFRDRHKVFRIRSADSAGHRSSIGLLVDKMYAWRKYAFTEPSDSLRHDPNRIALAVYDQDHAIATATLGLTEIGLLVDEARKSPRRCAVAAASCAMTKLAVEHPSNQRVLASLFHVSLITPIISMSATPA